jgi:hypothetical protein
VRRAPSTVGDCTGGEIVRVSSGVYRIVGGQQGLAWKGERKAYMLVGDPPRETKAPCVLALRTPILEVLDAPVGRAVDGGAEVDPVLKGCL